MHENIIDKLFSLNDINISSFFESMSTLEFKDKLRSAINEKMREYRDEYAERYPKKSSEYSACKKVSTSLSKNNIKSYVCTLLDYSDEELSLELNSDISKLHKKINFALITHMNFISKKCEKKIESLQKTSKKNFL